MYSTFFFFEKWNTTFLNMNIESRRYSKTCLEETAWNIMKSE